MKPPPGLWDSFWADHASSDRLFHRVLWRIRFLFSKAYAHRLLAAQPHPVAERVLEVGCGSASTLHYIHLQQPDSLCYAFDLSSQAVNVAQHLNPGFRPAVADARALPLLAHSVHLAFSIGLIEHFDRDVAAEIVREMVRVTQGGGWVAVMVPWRSSFYNLLRIAFGSWWPFGQENPFRRRELIHFMLQQELGEVQLHIIYGSTLLAIGRKPVPSE